MLERFGHAPVRVRRARRSSTIGLALLALAAVPLAWAEPPAKRPLAATEAGTPAASPLRNLRMRLAEERLSHRISVELESFTTFGAVTGQPGQLDDHPMFEEMTDSVKHGTKVVARRTVRKYLREAFGLDRSLSQIRRSLSGEDVGGASDFDVHISIHSGQPELGFSFEKGDAKLTWSVGTDGDIGVRLGGERFHGAGFSASYDGVDEYHLGARVVF